MNQCPNNQKGEQPGLPAGAHDFVWSRHCGARICNNCGDHAGLERCFCGWSKTDPGRGYQELIEMGEQIEEDY